MTSQVSREKHGRLLAIGDIHGCLFELTALLEEMAPRPEDQIVFLGDYIDRGPESAGVIIFLLEFQQQFPTTIFLRGNHEQMLLDFLNGQEPIMFLANGGIKTLSSYQAVNCWPIPAAHRIFFESSLHYYETEEFIFVHAGLRPGLPLAEQDISDMLWIRQDFVSTAYDWGKTIVYGHTPLQTPLMTATRLGLDTGCVYGRQLTGCEVRSRRLWQVNCPR